MAQSDVWYYAEGGDSRGPFSAAQLRDLIRNRSIREETLVWSEEIGQWTPFTQTRLRQDEVSPPSPSGPRVGAPSGEYGDAPARSISFGDAIRLFFGKYATFYGRASRAEFWYPFLFALLLGLGAGVVDQLLLGSNSSRPVTMIAQLAILIPSIAVGVRRLHDTDRTGWWYLIAFLPIIGMIVLIVFFVQRGTEDRNRFG